MIAPEKRKAIFLMHQEGMKKREIARKMSISPKTVNAIIKQQGLMPTMVRNDKIQLDDDLLRRLYQECNGYIQRVHEKLVEEEGVEIKYSTLTKLMRELEISTPTKSRCYEVPDMPGAEMQHDTTIYQVVVAQKRTRLTASLIYLRYSKRRYLKFYHTFKRFKMKCFFHEALTYWGYSAAECIIDNTNLARLRGTGKNAVIVPEMQSFSQQYGFKFVCHELNHPNRKAGDEKGLHTVETNFLPGRTFESLEDMNEQAFHWATERMYKKPLGKTKVIPAEAFECERPYLTKLPPHLPSPYLINERGTDQYGYVSFDGNYYWVPGTRRDQVKILEYSSRLQIWLNRKCLAEYQLPSHGIKNEKFFPEGMPRPRYQPNNRKRPAREEEKKLRSIDESVNSFLDFALKLKGFNKHRFLRELFALSKQMSRAIFIKTIERCHRYRITNMVVFKRIAFLVMNGGSPALPQVEVDEDFLNREAYLEGRLTETPDFSAYDNMLEADNV